MKILGSIRYPGHEAPCEICQELRNNPIAVYIEDPYSAIPDLRWLCSLECYTIYILSLQ